MQHARKREGECDRHGAAAADKLRKREASGGRETVRRSIQCQEVQQSLAGKRRDAPSRSLCAPSFAESLRAGCEGPARRPPQARQKGSAQATGQRRRRRRAAWRRRVEQAVAPASGRRRPAQRPPRPRRPVRPPRASQLRPLQRLQRLAAVHCPQSSAQHVLPARPTLNSENKQGTWHNHAWVQASPGLETPSIIRTATGGAAAAEVEAGGAATALWSGTMWQVSFILTGTGHFSMTQQATKWPLTSMQSGEARRDGPAHASCAFFRLSSSCKAGE